MTSTKSEESRDKQLEYKERVFDCTDDFEEETKETLKDELVPSDSATSMQTA